SGHRGVENLAVQQLLGVLFLHSGSTELMGSETARIHVASRRRGGSVAARGARAAAGNATASYFPSGNPDDPPDRDGWGERMACVFPRATPLGLRRYLHP